jgi:hypothetical protein
MRHDQHWYYHVERDYTNLTRLESLESDVKRLNGGHNTIHGKLVVKIISYLHLSSSCARTQPLGLLLLVVKEKALSRTLAGRSGDSVARQTHMGPRRRQQMAVAAACTNRAELLAASCHQRDTGGALARGRGGAAPEIAWGGRRRPADTSKGRVGRKHEQGSRP